MATALPGGRFLDDLQYLRHFWHPVCTLQELDRARVGGPVGVRLLDQPLVIARLGERVVALDDRCAHRSAKLSLGRVENGEIQCPYHGWSYGADGVCTRIPSCPGLQIPGKARVARHECEVRYGIVWVRLDGSYGITSIPYFSAAADARFRLAMDEPYTWATSAGRRWENYTDLAHFAFVHPVTLFDPAYPVPPIVPVDRVGGQLRWSYSPPRDIVDVMDKMSNMGPASYRCTMPFTVNLEYERFVDGTRSVLWMTSSPLDARNCRSFFILAREVDKEGSDVPYLEFQHRVLREDRPVIESQTPAEIDSHELSVPTDKVSMQYRRWLRELEVAAREGQEAFAACLMSDRLDPSRAQA